MAQNYTRQSSFADGDTITASLFNNEYNQLVNAFTYSSTDVDATGHRHDGTSGEGGNIYRIGDLNFLNKIEADSVNNRWGFFVEVSSTAVEQIRIQDGVILPVITNDIDLGSATFQFKDLYLDGTANIDSLVLSSGSTVTAILDENNLVSDSATALATQQSIKAYVDAQVTAQDLDFQGDTGGALSIDLDSETLTIAGGTGIDTVGATNTLTVSIDSTVATLTGTQTLTNKTIDADNNTVSNLEVDNLKTGVLDTDISSVAGTHTTLPSALAVKTYVDAQVTAQDLDIFGDTGTDAIDLDSETLTFTGGTGITSVVTAGTVTHNIDSTVATLTGTQTLTNKTLTSPDINGGTVDGAVIGGTTAAAGSFTNITVSGTVDGRDVAADGTKLDGIEALADVTDTTNVTAAGALMDSELTNITAVKALNQGVATTDSPSFAGLTATTADINAGTIDGTVIGGSTAAAITGTTITGTSFVSSGDMTFGDSDKAIFGAGSDLQIFHDGSNSYVQDAGDGALILNTTNGGGVYVYSAGETMATFNSNGAVNLYYDNAAKLATTATGIDVTGTVTADGLTVSGAQNSKVAYFDDSSEAGYRQLQFTSSTNGQYWDINSQGTSGGLGGVLTLSTRSIDRMEINTGGDISFYEDTGTTAKFFWDASAESLGIGATPAQAKLDILLESDYSSHTGHGLSILSNAANAYTSLYIGTDDTIDSAYIQSAGKNTSFTSKKLLLNPNGGNVGINVSSPTSPLHIRSAANVNVRFDDSGSSSYTWYMNDAQNLYIPNVQLASTHTFYANGQRKVDIDSSGNVGIGASSVGAKLHVLSGTDNNIAAGVSEVRFIGADKAITGEQANLVIQTNDDMAVNKGGSIGLGGRHTTSSTNGVNFAQISGRKENATSANFAGYLAFGTSDSASDIHERMRIDSSGNVGIGLSGAIPSARLQVRTGTNLNFAVQTGTTDTSGMKINAFNDAANTNIPLEINGSVLLLKTGETERMRIDASGNVGIGTTTPAAPLSFGSLTNDARIYLRGNTNEFAIGTNGSQTVYAGYLGHIFQTGSFGGAERMRIDASGNVGIGTSSPATPLEVDGIIAGTSTGVDGTFAPVFNSLYSANTAYYGQIQHSMSSVNTNSGFRFMGGGTSNATGAGGLQKMLDLTRGQTIFYTADTERMRIDSSGNLLVGRSSAGAAATDNGHVFYGSGQHYIFSNATECVRFYETSGSGQQVGSISITSSATAFNTSSDERLKENITDAPAGNVDDIKVRSFDWKADGSHQDYGMVAQELEAVAPYAVTKGETEDDMWSVDYSKLVPMLIKEIQDLKAEVAALKGAN
jgi:hypothetical protein